MTTAELFTARETTRESLQAAGWHVEPSSGGGWWFRHSSGERYPVPAWVQEMTRASYRNGVEDTQFAIRSALGIKR